MFEIAASMYRAAGVVELADLWPIGSRLLILALVLLAGCEKNGSSSPPMPTKNAAEPRASVALKVLVVNDPKLAEAINRLRGEWAERSGGTLSAESLPWTDVAKAENVDADVIIFPARCLGELVEAKRLRPIRDAVVNSKIYNADDVLPLVLERLGTYGGRTMALPMSVELPLVGSDRESVENWPAIILLARAAGYATHPRQDAVLFDPQTMAARIAEPPFVRALEEWQKEEKAATKPGEKQMAWSEIPGADQVFNRSTGEWEPVAGGARQVPLLAGGQLLAVTSASRNAASAFDLAAWLASAEIAQQLGPIAKGALPVRRSQLSTSGRWIDSPAGRANNAKLASVLQSALNRDEALMVPRIPGADEYLAALAASVAKALRGEASAADALTEAARQWDQITERRGRDAQRRAYLKDLGIEEP